MTPTHAPSAAGRQRFERALRDAGATRDGGELFAELVAHYGEPHRHYHTLAHVEACLARLDRVGAGAQSRAEVELALWFHDVVYDPRAKNNELRSGRLAAGRLGALGTPVDAIERIVTSIIATAQHTAHGSDSALVNDLDLGVFGAEREEFDRFERDVRQEYAHVPEPLFRIGRSRVLRSFLNREPLYHVPEIRAALETRARANLSRRLQELTS